MSMSVFNVYDYYDIFINVFICAYQQRDGQAELTWVTGYTYRDSLPARRRSPTHALTGPSVE